MKAGLGLAGLMLFVCFTYAFSNPQPNGYFDYQFRIATAMLHGRLGIEEHPPWLSELVPFGGQYYSVFPLGSVLCMLPVALVQSLRHSDEFPARTVIAWVAGTTALFLVMLSGRYGDRLPRRLMLVLLMLFGTWTWCNLAYGGAWQLALALAMLGQVGALAFTLINRQPLVAGLLFAVAYGNRTEILLTAPLLLYLLVRYDPIRNAGAEPAPLRKCLKTEWKAVVGFLLFPFLLGVATLVYNAARFHSPTDFGYARIPGILNEEWYRHGFFSLYAVPMNLHAMLLASPWQPLGAFPYFKPEPFGGSIFGSSPFLLLVFREGTRDRGLKITAWCAIALLTAALWLHGNAGGWQFSYRYATVLLPWLFVLLLDQRGGKISAVEGILFTLSLAINAFATYMYFWSPLMRWP
jgi:hypothetical protein